MKNTGKLITLLVCLLLAFALSNTAFAQELTFTDKLAEVASLTDGLSVTGSSTEEVNVVNSEKIALDWSAADPSIGRMSDGWWAGIKVVADADITAEELKAVSYRTLGKEGWSEAKSFWSYKDSADDASEHFITLWLPVTPELIKNDDDGFLTLTYEFDWDNDGFDATTQTVIFKVDVTKVELLHKAGHTEVVTEEEVPAGCFEKGYTKQSHCSVCGLVLSERKEIPAYDKHDFSVKIIAPEYLAQEANCIHYDQYFYKCSRCDVLSGRDKLFEDTEGSELVPHDYVKKLDSIHLASPADCENPAVYYMGCSNCDTTFAETFTDGTPLYHSWKIEKVTKKASIKADGAINFFCEDCGKMDDYPIPLAKIASVQLSKTKYDYTGKVIRPGVTVKDSKGKVLVNGKDYTVAYIGDDLPGTATAKITFKGNYEGTYDAKYSVVIPTTGKIVYSASTSAIKISWTKVGIASGYAVYYKTEKGWKHLGNTTATSATFSKLPSGTKYTFAVKSLVKKNGTLYPSTGYTTADTTTLSPATSKIAASQSTSAIKLTWTSVKNAEGYAVYEKTNNGWKLIKVLAGTSLTISGRKAGTSYTYAVKSVDLTASGSMAGGSYRQIVTGTKPAKPTVSVTTADGDATIRWTGVKGASAYEVYYKSERTNGFVLLGTVDAGTTVFEDTDYTTGSKYVFAVRAKMAVQGGYIYSATGQSAVITMK